MNPSAPAYLTSHQIAKLVHVSPSTVLSWIDKGLLEAHRTPGGHRRVERGALVAFLRAHRMPVPRDLISVVRLLVIDDEAPVLRAVKRALKKPAPWIEVETADNGSDGLIKLGTFQADVVLLDAYMEGLDGMEVCRILRGRKETQHIIVIALTAYATDEVEGGFLSAGAVAVLPKPLEVPRFLEILAKAGLRKESPL